MKSQNKIGLLLITIMFVPQSVFATGASQAAEGASQSQSAAQMASQMMSALLAPGCATTPPQPTCPMSMLAAAQAMTLGGNSKDSKAAASALSTGSLGGGATTIAAAPTPSGSLTGSASGLDSSAARSGLAKLGYSLSADGSKLTLPNGKTIPTGSFGTAEGMAAAGFSESQIAASQAALADAQAKVAAKMKLGSLETGGGDGGGGGGGLPSSGRGASEFAFKFPSGPRKAAPSVSGMTKNFGGEKIGVSGDNIFEMITRQYKSQDTSNGFLKN